MRKTESMILEAVHETAQGLHDAGDISASDVEAILMLDVRLAEGTKPFLIACLRKAHLGEYINDKGRYHF